MKSKTEPIKICEYCERKEIKFVKYIYKNGSVNVRQQCLNCGKLYSAGFKSIDFNLHKLPLADLDKREETVDFSLRRLP